MLPSLPAAQQSVSGVLLGGVAWHFIERCLHARTPTAWTGAMCRKGTRGKSPGCDGKTQAPGWGHHDEGLREMHPQRCARVFWPSLDTQGAAAGLLPVAGMPRVMSLRLSTAGMTVDDLQPTMTARMAMVHTCNRADQEPCSRLLTQDLRHPDLQRAKRAMSL